LRVVRARHVPGQGGDPGLWFMDYRNADGSVAEMCGNGVRVFARYLVQEKLADPPVIPIGTRDGVKEAVLLDDGRIRVAMGPVQVSETTVTVLPTGAEQQPVLSRPADVGNPHAVAFVDDLAALDLHRPPTWSPAEAFPDGVNLEFVQRLGPHHVAMRVYERGSGETRSCGTGTCAVAAVAAREAGQTGPLRYRVDVPGGTVEVELDAEQSFLTGPAVIVAAGELLLPDSLPDPRR
jgi:diaminopimelate epimerase